MSKHVLCYLLIVSLIKVGMISVYEPHISSTNGIIETWNGEIPVWHSGAIWSSLDGKWWNGGQVNNFLNKVVNTKQELACFLAKELSKHFVDKW